MLSAGHGVGPPKQIYTNTVILRDGARNLTTKQLSVAFVGRAIMDTLPPLQCIEANAALANKGSAQTIQQS